MKNGLVLFATLIIIAACGKKPSGAASDSFTTPIPIPGYTKPTPTPLPGPQADITGETTSAQPTKVLNLRCSGNLDEANTTNAAYTFQFGVVLMSDNSAWEYCEIDSGGYNLYNNIVKIATIPSNGALPACTINPGSSAISFSGFQINLTNAIASTAISESGGLYTMSGVDCQPSY